MTSERFRDRWSLKSVLGSFDKDFSDFVLKGSLISEGRFIGRPDKFDSASTDDMNLVSAENTKSQNIEAIAQKMYDYAWLRERYKEPFYSDVRMEKEVHLRRVRNKFIWEVIKSLDTYIPEWKESLGGSETVRVKIQSAEDEQRELGLGGEQIKDFFATGAAIALGIIGVAIALAVIWSIWNAQGVDNCWHC